LGLGGPPFFFSKPNFPVSNVEGHKIKMLPDWASMGLRVKPNTQIEFGAPVFGPRGHPWTRLGGFPG